MSKDQNSNSTFSSKRRSRPHRWRILCILILLICVVGYVGYIWVAKLMVSAIIYAPNHGQTVDSLKKKDLGQVAASKIDQQLRIQVGPPEASLSLAIIEPNNNAESDEDLPLGTIFLLHGIRGNKSHMVGMGRLLADNGYRAVLVDLRGHGTSTGNWLTYGAVESRDLSQIIDALDQQKMIAGRIGVYGASYGGAAAIISAGLDSRITAIVTVATFSSFREVIPNYARRYLVVGFLLTDSWINKVIYKAGVLAGFNPDQASPVEAIQKTSAQVLLIHGKQDNKIPCSHSQTLYEASPNRSRLILVDNEDHDSIMQDRSGIISRETIAWFKQYLQVSN
ncbi:MAG: alpha/beta fold hydrolase [Planctomycetota bacterium]|nr:MAG: alpha/beta fold hydrolase [Planctomycetota bacterium]